MSKKKTLFSRDKLKNNKQQLRRVTKASNRILFRVKAVFPFDFFPNELIIDENSVNIVYKYFFFSREVSSMPFENINACRSSVGLLFGTIYIELEGYNRNPPPLRYLWRKDAYMARRMITGLITCQKQQIDLRKLDLNEVKEKIMNIGMVKP